MPNYLDIPFLNPVRFYEADYQPLPNYNGIHMDDNRFIEQRLPWQEPVKYYQKWQTNDIIYLQFLSEYSPINVYLMDCNENEIQQFVAEVITTQLVDSFSVYEVSIALNTFDEGIYYLKIVAGAGDDTSTLVSEPFDLKETHPFTRLLKYSHSKNREDVVFATGIVFNLRVEGHISDYEPATDEKGYIDQVRSETILTSHPYRVFKFFLGDEAGVPPWMPDIVVRAFGCDSVEIDGKLYAKAGGSKMEKRTEERYPMATWVIDLREGRNRSSKRVGIEGVSGNEIIISYNIETAGFGDLNGPASSNVVQVTDIE